MRKLSKKIIESQKTNDILDDTFTLSEKFIIDSLVSTLVKICIKKCKNLENSVKVLFIVIEDKEVVSFIKEQLNYISNQYGTIVSNELYDIIKIPQFFHLYLLKQFIQEYRQCYGKLTKKAEMNIKLILNEEKC